MKPKTHELKCWTEYYQLVIDDVKRFELRKDDRSYRDGDYLKLREWSPVTQQYTGRTCKCDVQYVLRNTEHLAHGYCAMSIELLYEENHEA